jgi:hypothetical protein
MIDKMIRFFLHVWYHGCSATSMCEPDTRIGGEIMGVVHATGCGCHEAGCGCHTRMLTAQNSSSRFLLVEHLLCKRFKNYLFGVVVNTRRSEIHNKEIWNSPCVAGGSATADKFRAPWLPGSCCFPAV